MSGLTLASRSGILSVGLESKILLVETGLKILGQMMKDGCKKWVPVSRSHRDKLNGEYVCLICQIASESE